MKIKTAGLLSILFMSAALILMCTPYAAALRFAQPYDQSIKVTFSYFSMMVLGYGNIYPMLTGVCAISSLLLLIVVLIWNRLRILTITMTLACACFSILAITFSTGITIVSVIISFCIFLSTLFQLVPKKLP